MYSAGTLILTQNYVPVEIWPCIDAIKLLFRGEHTGKQKAYVVESYDAPVKTAGVTIPIPRVMAIFNRKLSVNRKVRFQRLSCIYRDDQRCAYCGQQFPVNMLTLDHIIPISRWAKLGYTGTPTNWNNCVSCCKPCNNKKGSMTADEFARRTGMKLRFNPVVPKYVKSLHIQRHVAESNGWMPYLDGQFTVSIHETLDVGR